MVATIYITWQAYLSYINPDTYPDPISPKMIMIMISLSIELYEIVQTGPLIGYFIYVLYYMLHVSVFEETEVTLIRL